MTYTQDELLQIYHQIYRHTVLTLVRDEDHRIHIDLILEIAEFANQIATDPDGETTQESARDHLEFLTRIHREMIDKLEQDEWPHPCECMRYIIRQRVELLERHVDQLSDDDTEQSQAIWTVYERWLAYDYRMRQNP